MCLVFWCDARGFGFWDWFCCLRLGLVLLSDCLGVVGCFLYNAFCDGF